MTRRRISDAELRALSDIEEAARRYASLSHGNYGRSDLYRAREEARERLRDALARLDRLRAA